MLARHGQRIGGLTDQPVARMREPRMPVDKEPILDYFSGRSGHGRGPLLHETAYYLMRIIFMNRDFDDLDQLIDFCGNPENLHAWLPNETDRIVLSAALRDGLQDMIADSGSAPNGMKPPPYYYRQKGGKAGLLHLRVPSRQNQGQ
jgi:hypothetical protein